MRNAMQDDSTRARTAAPLARLEHVAVGFDGRDVLRDVSLTIEPGAFTALLGRSGCGKSTLLRVVAGLLAPCAGRVETRGTQALGFQDARLVPWIRVWDNVTLGMPGRRRQRRALASDALAQVGLADHARDWPSALSGGQAQRASLARALVRRPDLLLLDEPFGALDSLTRLDMQDLLASLARDHGCATLMVTHDIAEAVRLADRVLVMADGVIARDVNVDRARLDGQGRPVGHGDVEDALRAALR